MNEEQVAQVAKELGRRGGLACLHNRGYGFYKEIGSLGQKVMRSRYPGKAREWGKLGGRPRKLSLEDVGVEAKQLKERRFCRPA